MRPIIGLTHSIQQDERTLHMPLSYARAITAAGGLPIVLPAVTDGHMIEAYLDQVDGLLLTGGDDVDPLLYGECQHWACGSISPLRDAFEVQLCRAALRRKDMPVLGVCRGVQLLNVACGGTLWQDLQSSVKDCICHRQHQNPEYASHPVSLVEGSRLATIYGALGLLVNSHHHQAVNRPGDGLTVCATAPDGVIEGVEMTDHPFCIGVQWHPERLFDQVASCAQLRLFEAFVKACQH